MALKNILNTYLLKGRRSDVPLIIGTTGDLPMKEIELMSKNAPVTICPNFSLGMKTVEDMLKTVPSNVFSVEMTEIHHTKKKDAPSGTAKRLAEIIDTENIHSMRLNDTIGEHTVFLSLNGERIEIKHTVTDRNIFATGAIRVANWTIEQKNGLYYI